MGGCVSIAKHTYFLRVCVHVLIDGCIGILNLSSLICSHLTEMLMKTVLYLKLVSVMMWPS